MFYGCILPKFYHMPFVQKKLTKFPINFFDEMSLPQTAFFLFPIFYTNWPSLLGIRALNLLIRSFRSNQMSDCEWFAQIAQDKSATVSESLRLLRGNEWPWANCSGRLEKRSDYERSAQVTQDKWVTLSDLLRSLRGNDPILAKKI